MYVRVCVRVHAASDSDDNERPSHAPKSTADVSATGTFPSKLHSPRIVKYNFLDLSKCDVFVIVVLLYLSLCLSLSLSLCVCFNVHFPGGPGLAGTRMFPL